MQLRQARTAELWPPALHQDHVGSDGLWDPVKSFDLTRALTPPDQQVKTIYMPRVHQRSYLVFSNI